MPRGQRYKETTNQVAFTQLMNFSRVRERSRSFRRLEHAVEELLDAIDTGSTGVTPSGIGP